MSGYMNTIKTNHDCQEIKEYTNNYNSVNFCENKQFPFDISEVKNDI